MFELQMLAITGFGISVYAHCVENKIQKNPIYKPFCDLSDVVSCSKPIKSQYGKIFFVSNADIGMVYFALIQLFILFRAHALLLLTVIGGCIASCILAYILYFKIRAFCIVCTSIYLINFLMLILLLL